MDIFADLYQEVFAVDDSITFRYQIPYSGGKTPIQAVATVFLDQKKFGMKEFTNTGEVSYNVNGMNKLIPDKSTYDNVKDLGGDALQRWAENAVSTDSSYFLNILETPIDERTIAYASYLHVVYDKDLLPEDGTIFMKGASLGGIADGTGGGVGPVNYDLRDPDNNGFGVHLHFELYIPKDLNAFRPDGRLFNVQKYSAGSVNPRKYISFEDQEYWQY